MTKEKQGQTLLPNTFSASYTIEGERLIIQPAVDVAELLRRCGLDTSACTQIEIAPPIVKGGIENSEKLGKVLEAKMPTFKKDGAVIVATERYKERWRAHKIQEVLREAETFKAKVLGVLDVVFDGLGKSIVSKNVSPFKRVGKSVALYSYCIPNILNRDNTNDTDNIKIQKTKTEFIQKLFTEAFPNVTMREENETSLAALRARGSWRRRIVLDGKLMANKQKYNTVEKHKSTATLQKKTIGKENAESVWLQEIEDYKRDNSIAEEWNAKHVLGIVRALYTKAAGVPWFGTFSGSTGRDRRLAAEILKIIVLSIGTKADAGNYLLWAFDKKFPEIDNPAMFVALLFKEKLVQEYLHAKKSGKTKNKKRKAW